MAVTGRTHWLAFDGDGGVGLYYVTNLEVELDTLD